MFIPGFENWFPLLIFVSSVIQSNMFLTLALKTVHLPLAILAQGDPLSKSGLDK